MLYYLELDKNKEFLEVKEAPNIHNLSKALKIAWGDLNYYLNGNDHPVKWLPCGQIMPFIKRNGKMYRISYYDKIINMENYSFMSREVYKDIEFMNQYGTVKATSSKQSVKEIKDEQKVSTNIITECNYKTKSRYSNAIDGEING